MTAPSNPIGALCTAATGARDALDYRRAALTLVSDLIPSDAALFHELSPRVPLARAAIIGIAAELLARHSRQWDDLAVHLQPLLRAALNQGGAATDRDAFGISGKRRRPFEERVAKPLGIKHLLIGHLVRDGRVLSAITLLRRSSPFALEERRSLAELLPCLTLGDHFWQGKRTYPGLLVQPRCRDQRLTARQQQVVEFVALGHTNAQIGLALGISLHTVRNTLVHICQRLGASNRADVVRLAVLSPT